MTSRTTPISRAGAPSGPSSTSARQLSRHARQRQLGLVVAQAGRRRAAPGPAARPARPRPARRCRRARPRSRGRAPQRLAAVQRAGGQLVAPGADPGHPLQLGGPAALGPRRGRARAARARRRAGRGRGRPTGAGAPGPGRPPHQLRRGAGPTTSRRAGAEQPRLGPAGEPQQRGVDLHDPVGAVEDERPPRRAEVGQAVRTERGAARVGGAASVEQVAAGHRRDRRRRLGGRRRGALDDAQRGVPRDAEHAGPGRGSGAQARSAGGRDLDGRLVAVASGRRERHERGPRARVPASTAGGGPAGRSGRPRRGTAGDSATTRASREANSAASGCGSVPYRACCARCRSTRATGSSGCGRPASSPAPSPGPSA